MLHTNDDFLRAVEAAPRETTLRLAYADWLTEQDNPRGELIRIEEEMRALPVFADRFWELKPQRNQLRAEAGAEWCAQMRYGTECLPVFTHGIPDGWRERWRLIREFTERWHRVPMPDIGGRQAEIAETEKRLGRVLPPSVREWVAFAQDVRHLQAFSSDLDNQLTLQPLVDELALSLLYVPYDEGHRAVRFAEFDAADPPVEYYRQEFNGADLPATCVSIPDPYFPIQPVTGWVFDHLIPRLPARGGRFHYDVTDPASFYPEFDRRLSPRVRVGNS